MATYNGERFIREQIESVLPQLKNDDEFLIFDDISTDATAKVISEFESDIRVKFKANAMRLGVVKNFERALEEATGDYIFLCDQDDIWMPNKVAECVDALQQNLLVVTDCNVVDESLNELNASFFEMRHSGTGIRKNIWRNSYLGCCMAFRKELLKVSLPIPAKVPMHDMWLGLLSETQGSVLFLPKKLSSYRRHQFAVSPTAMSSNFNLIKKLKIRSALVFFLIQRLLSFKFKKISMNSYL